MTNETIDQTPLPEPFPQVISPQNKNLRKEVRAALVLQRLSGVGAVTYWKLREIFSSNVALLSAPISKLEIILKSEALQQLQQFRDNTNSDLQQQLEKDTDWLQNNNVSIVLFEDAHYPELLKNIPAPPPVIFVRGDKNCLNLPQVAVVGSRNPTVTGRENAESFSRELGHIGFAITSGLALGVDAAAHCGALSVKAKTVAVLGTGIDQIYPARHRKLAEEIVESGGCLVTEFPIGTKPHASNFPRRNRIISGLSVGVLVVEAAVKSGSLITARCALQQDREVFAIPGSIHNPLSRGCHAILKDGAVLVESVEDMREPLQGLLQYKLDESAKHNAESVKAEQFKTTDKTEGLKREPGAETLLGHDEKQVLESLGFEGVGAETICTRTRLDMGTVLAALITLELEGVVEQSPDGYQRIGSTRHSSKSDF